MVGKTRLEWMQELAKQPAPPALGWFGNGKRAFCNDRCAFGHCHCRRDFQAEIADEPKIGRNLPRLGLPALRQDQDQGTPQSPAQQLPVFVQAGEDQRPRPIPSLVAGVIVQLDPERRGHVVEQGQRFPYPVQDVIQSGGR